MVTAMIWGLGNKTVLARSALVCFAFGLKKEGDKKFGSAEVEGVGGVGEALGFRV